MTKPDAHCANCDERVFWATAGWWLHMHFSVKCFTPAVVSLRKRAKSVVQALPRTIVVPQVLSVVSPGIVVSQQNAAVHMRSRSIVVYRQRMAYRNA